MKNEMEGTCQTHCYRSYVSVSDQVDLYREVLSIYISFYKNKHNTWEEISRIRMPRVGCEAAGAGCCGKSGHFIRGLLHCQSQ